MYGATYIVRLVGVYRRAKCIIIYQQRHTHVRARIPFAHTHGIHFCIRTYFHTFAPTYTRDARRRDWVCYRIPLMGGRACAFGVCACVRGKSTVASSSENSAKARERQSDRESDREREKQRKRERERERVRDVGEIERDGEKP